jgi:hypothetical protein
MDICASHSELECLPLLELINEFDAIVNGMVQREMSYGSERPQDFVVPILAVRAFRLGISSIRLALSGYTDSASNIHRTIYEIGIRLLDMEQDPVAASLGFLLQGAFEEISTMRAEFEYRENEHLKTHHLSINIQTLKKHRNLLCEIAKNRGYDPETIRKRFGKLNVREICQRYGIEKSYLVDYAYFSSYIHEKNVATSHFYSESADSRNFEFGPISEDISYSIADTMNNTIRVIEFGCIILKDKILIERTQELSRLLSDRLKSLGMGE